jgi:nucleoside-triphosphatase
MNPHAIHPQAPGRILLVTGIPGIGKTTVIRELARRLVHRKLCGFYTEEMRICGERVGFRLVTLKGEEAVIAHIDFRDFPHVSKYGVDVAAIDAVATDVLALKPGVEVYLVDEVGKMESLSLSFVQAMRGLLASDKLLIATTSCCGRSPEPTAPIYPRNWFSGSRRGADEGVVSAVGFP